VLNPFVHGRLAYGQLFLVGAYALLPWTAVRLRRLVQQPGFSNALLCALGLALVSAFSLHVLVIAGLIAAALLVTHTLTAKPKLGYLKRTGPWVLVALAVTGLARAYWSIPLLLGRSAEGAVLTGTGAADLAAYAAVSDTTLGLVPNL